MTTPSEILDAAAEWDGEPFGRGRLLFVPLDLATQPTNGDCLTNNWWSVHPTKGLAYYYQPFGYARSEEPSPQCNSSEATARHLTRRLYPTFEVLLMPVVFSGHARRAMAKDRAALRRAADLARAAETTPETPTGAS